MIRILLAALALAPSITSAQQPCEFERTEELRLDLADISTLQISIGPDALRLEGRDDVDGVLRVRMCASSQERLDGLNVSQIRPHAGRLQVELDHGGRANRHMRVFLFFSVSDYGRFEIAGNIPTTLAVDLTVGSGNARVSDVAELEAVVGSGDLAARGISGTFRVQVGSGDIVGENVGALEIGNIGSGDVTVTQVHGDARIGSIGSGDLRLHEVRGSVAIGPIGSGDARLRDIDGNVEVRTLGSGDLDVRGVGGDLTVRSKGSGDIVHSDVAGAVSLPRR
ncbi:MAG: hypothetical protein JJU27_02990 [Gammaproteobacteria bacterium]|nr:hypothetical protein [Gammaproteobacteria bacterium]